jgi:glycerol-3-phosphate dehydrogenase
VAPSATDAVPLLGAQGYGELVSRRASLAREAGLGEDNVTHLLERYGSLATEILSLIDGRRELSRPLDGAEDYLRAEVLYAASHEGALHLDDVLTRRTRISIETFDRGLSAAPAVAELMGEVLGWDDETRRRELWHYEARVAAERESQEQPDDRTADAARLGAPDVRTGRR